MRIIEPKDVEAAVQAIVRGEQGDPFTWLGMHCISGTSRAS